MSGPELARRLIAARPAVKTLFMSGYTGDAMDRHGALDSPLAFVQKPFTPETLERKVRDALESRERNVDHHIRGP
jgi:FixJ family two-component response regulator